MALGAALLLLLVVKLVYEQQSAPACLTGDLPLVPDAHLFGALGGLIGALSRRACRAREAAIIRAALLPR